MLFKSTITFVFLGVLSAVYAIDSKDYAVPARYKDSWYRSFSDTFAYCVAVNFKSPGCPPVSNEEKYTAQIPFGGLSPATLLQATEAYRSGLSPKDWLLSLKLHEFKFSSDTQDAQEQLVAHARWLLAEILYDQREFEAADKIYDEIIPFFKGRALFHQQRAWVKYFRGQFGAALGSLMSAESPLVYRMPFIDKYFLKALIDRDTCQYTKALATLSEGRRLLSEYSLNISQIPWVKTCQDRKMGAVCERLNEWALDSLKKNLDQAKLDLDFIELELADRGFQLGSKAIEKEVVWPYVGEKWGDELGHYHVEVPEKCTRN